MADCRRTRLSAPWAGYLGFTGCLGVWWFLLSSLTWQIQLGIVAAYFLLSWRLCNGVVARLGVKDEPQIVADEVAGMWLALVWLPQSLGWALAAFVMFRLADIFKPGPIGVLDRQLHSGLGIMADDLLAGAVSAALLTPMAAYWPM